MIRSSDYQALDSIYHSESMHEMQVKADIHSIDLADPEVIAWLASNTAYHHAFWPHTAKRFTAFKQLLRHMLRKHMCTAACILEAVQRTRNKIDATRSMMYDCTGKRQEIKNLAQVVSILQHGIELLEEHNP